MSCFITTPQILLISPHLKLTPTLQKKLCYSLQQKLFKIDEKCFLFHLQSSFRSQDFNFLSAYRKTGTRDPTQSGKPGPRILMGPQRDPAKLKNQDLGFQWDPRPQFCIKLLRLHQTSVFIQQIYHFKRTSFFINQSVLLPGSS